MACLKSTKTNQQRQINKDKSTKTNQQRQINLAKFIDVKFKKNQATS